MRSLYCMTAAAMLAAGVSARADVVGMLNVPGAFTNSIKVSDQVVIDTTIGVGESASAFYAPVNVVDQENIDPSRGAACLVADVCGSSASTDEANDSSAVPLQTAIATRSAEPSSVALLGTGLLGFAAVMRRRFVA